jgi:hypothetical protein
MRTWTRSDDEISDDGMLSIKPIYEMNGDGPICYLVGPTWTPSHCGRNFDTIEEARAYLNSPEAAAYTEESRPAMESHQRIYANFAPGFGQGAAALEAPARQQRRVVLFSRLALASACAAALIALLRVIF